MESLSLQEAQQILLQRANKINSTETISLWESNGRVLAEDMIAQRSQPPFSRSPLDGYAIRSADVTGSSHNYPKILSVIDEVMAGHVTKRCVGEGEAIRIMTGAPIPKGADCVIRQEDTDYGEDKVQIYKAVGHFENYCFEGEDYIAGTRLLKKGTVLGAIEIGVIASLGLDKVLVYRRVRAALLTTGDETVQPGQQLESGKIYDSNLYTLGSQLLSWGIDLIHRESQYDDVYMVSNWIQNVEHEVDLIITTGGVSVGKKDIMHEVLESLDCEKLFWGIEIKPGMPTLCALYREKLLICLSGNPFGATVNLELLVRPIISLISGREDLQLKKVNAVMLNEFLKSSKVTRYVRAYYNYVNQTVKVSEGSNDSGILSSMCGCNCLIEIPANTRGLNRGDVVKVMLL